MLKLRISLAFYMLLSRTVFPAFSQDFKPLYADDGVKFGKVTYIRSEQKPDAQLAKVLKEKVFHSRACPPGVKRSYLYNKIELNSDGKPEVMAYVTGDCGGTGGCPLIVLSKRGNRYTVVSETTLVRQPIIVSNTKTKRWRDLIVSASGNSAHPDTGAYNHFVALKWTQTPMLHQQQV